MRYGVMKETLLLFAKYLGNFLTKIQNQQLVSSMILNFLPRPYVIIKKTFHIGCLLCVEFCQVLLTLVKRFIMLPRSRSRTHLIYMLLLHQKYTKTYFCLLPVQEQNILRWMKNMFLRTFSIEAAHICGMYMILILRT